jgi:hypothetical protein
LEKKLKYSNQYGVPEEFCEAVLADPYNRGDADFSVTQLIEPPQIKRLWDEHGDDIVTDMRDEMWRLFGQGVHEVLSRFGGGVKEERLFGSLDHFDIVSGQIDRRLGTTIKDYKVTKVYAWQQGIKPEWESQVNLYAWLCSENNIEIDSAEINLVLRDWTKSWYKPGGEYPDSMIQTFIIPLWPKQEQEDYIRERIAIHTQEETAPCTAEETWDRPSWQHQMLPAKNSKTGKGRTKNYNDLGKAMAAAKERGGTIVAQEGTPIRCTGDWCGVAAFCPQFKATTEVEEV